MGQFGKAAVKAVEIIENDKTKTPQEAWLAGISHFSTSAEVIKKGCPKNTFLSLCETGVVKGVPEGSYTRANENKNYALKAISLLRSNSNLNGLEKKKDGQTDVITSLWDSGLIDL